MSRIGKQPVTVPNGVKAIIAGQLLKIEGPKGRAQNSRADAQESELSKENMRGIGNERQSRQDPSIDDDQELGR